MNKNNKERLLELLADQTIFKLSEEEMLELQRLKTQMPDWEDDYSFELAAAKIGLINLDDTLALPDNLRTKILADADNFFSSAEESQTFAEFKPEKKSASLPEESGSLSSSLNAFWQWFGWAAAAAACIVLAINIYTTRYNSQTEIVRVPEAVQTPTPEIPAAQKREQLMATATDLITKEWKSPTGNSDIKGDVVWSNSQQKGFVRFSGMPVNDPNKETYQLWVFDEAQNEKYPIDGGVFNVTSNGEIIVPIDAAITVKKPVMFAVTAEKPGGVVVSSRKNLLAIAKI